MYTLLANNTFGGSGQLNLKQLSAPYVYAWCLSMWLVVTPVVDCLYDSTHEFEGIAETRVLPATIGCPWRQHRDVDERTDPEVGAREPRESSQLEASCQVWIRRVRRDAIALHAKETLTSASQ